MEITSLSKRYSEYSGIISRPRNALMVKTFVRLEFSFVTYAGVGRGDFLVEFKRKMGNQKLVSCFNDTIEFILVRNSD